MHRDAESALLGTLKVVINVVSTSTVTASTTSTVTRQPTATSTDVITQFADTTVFPALTTITVTAKTPNYEVSTTTQVATLTATLTEPTYAACAPSNALSEVDFTNGTVGAPLAPASMGNGGSVFLVASYGGTQVDCCDECFGTPGCAGAYTAEGFASPQLCYVFVDTSSTGTCMQSAISGAYQWESLTARNQNMGPYEVLYNGPCGYMYDGGWNGH